MTDTTIFLNFLSVGNLKQKLRPFIMLKLKLNVFLLNRASAPWSTPPAPSWTTTTKTIWAASVSRKRRRNRGTRWPAEVVRSLKLGNVWVFVQLNFCLQISCTKTQTLPNLRLFTTFVDKCESGDFSDGEEAENNVASHLTRADSKSFS